MNDKERKWLVRSLLCRAYAHGRRSADCAGQISPPAEVAKIDELMSIYESKLISSVALTIAEREVLDDWLAGWHTDEIADRREVSVQTIETQLQRIYKAFGVNSKSALKAAAYAYLAEENT